MNQVAGMSNGEQHENMMVLTSHNRLGDTGKRRSLARELASCLLRISEAGAVTALASPKVSRRRSMPK